MTGSADPSSFRDPGGVVFFRDNAVYRQINAGAALEAYERLMRSGLYEALTGAGLLLPHEEVGLAERYSDEARVVLRPERVPFISYPYEWCFGQLRDAALLTLQIQREALRFDLSLKDASAYNVQFRLDCRPVLIDTLSFEPYAEGAPWVAYRQFCQHFLAPLALMAHVDVRLVHLLRAHVDGIPLDLAARLLPRRARLDPALLPHLFLHSAAQQRHADAPVRAPAPASSGRVSRNALLGLLDSLEGGVRRLRWQPRGTEWGDYYENTNYDAASFAAKERMVARFLSEVEPAPSRAIDLGANTGVFSRIASGRGIPTLAFDIDPAAVEKNYRACRDAGERNLLPLVQDLTNPSPGLGWAEEERGSLLRRCAAESDAGPTVVFALALVHHLAIGNNVPLPKIADLFNRFAEFLIVEFVPKEDSQVRRLLARRADIFPDYAVAGFESAFAARFALLGREEIPGTERTLYLMRRKEAAL